MSDQAETLKATKPTLTIINMVLLAQSHNPSILTPDWFKDHCNIQEKVENFLCTPELSVLKTEELQIVCDNNRFQILPTKQSAITRTVDIVKRYVSTLSHIPLTALGFNFTWNAPKSCDIAIEVNKRHLPGQLNSMELSYGAIIYGKSEDWKMKLAVETGDANEQVFNFNFHFDLKDKTDKLGEFIESFQSQLISSEKIVTSIFLS
ncbi:MAG: hypothetical protein H0X66_10245 [Verrucomicrobia bacterium]|nr:hypothetical protein [Verrucomicrobiota bacterium]